MYRLGLFFFTLFLLFLSFIYLEVAVVPFMLALVLSYILWPINNLILRHVKINESALAAVMVLAFLAFFIGILTLLTPIAYEQLTLLVVKVEHYRIYIQKLISMMSGQLDYVSPQYAKKVQDFIDESVKDVAHLAFGGAEMIFNYTMATINSAITIFIVPVITFYILRDWSMDNLNLKKYFGLEIATEVNNVIKKINEVLSGYIRGQLNVCILMAIYYSFWLWLIGFEFAFLMAIFTSIAIAVPFVGWLVSFSIASTIGYFHYGISIELFYVFLIYGCGSILEGSILVPRIIGHKIGLHPLWVIFAVLSFAKLFGFIGLLCAIPLAGITKVVIVSILNRLAKKYGNAR